MKHPIVAHVNWDIGKACEGCKSYEPGGYCMNGPDFDMIYIDGDEIRCSGYKTSETGASHE